VPERLGQFGKCPADGVRQVNRVEHICLPTLDRRRMYSRGSQRLEIRIVCGCLATRMLFASQKYVSADREKPGPALRSGRVTTPRPIRAKKRFLNEILGVRFIARQ
jgi:hypothetical protein